MAEQTETTPTIEDQDGAFEDRINDLVGRLENITKDVKTVGTELKTLKKEHTRIVKKINGSRRKKTPKDPNAPKKAPSGFAKPTKISAKLAEFLGVSEGDLIARPDVTKGITAYVKKHNLQKEENKRVIDLTKPGGEALIELLNIPQEETLTFFNLQKYLKVHFPAAPKEAKEPKEPKEPKQKTESKKKTKKDETTEETTATTTKKKSTKKAAETEESEEPKEKKGKASKAKAAAAVDEEAPAAEEKPRRRRRVEEAA